MDGYDRDFDWSFINENSDTYVVEKLAPSLLPELRELMKTTFENKWTALMVGPSATAAVTITVIVVATVITATAALPECFCVFVCTRLTLYVLSC